MFSLGKTLYSLTSRRPRQEGNIARAPRPDGPLIWLHAATDGASNSGLTALARRLNDEHDLNVLHTPQGRGNFSDSMPNDVAAEVDAFLEHWHPDAMVMTGGELRPALLQAAQLRGIPALLVDGAEPVLMRGIDAWLPGLARSAARRYAAILTADEGAARSYRKLGAAQVARIGRMESGSMALPYHEPERAALAAMFATRPVWLAVALPAAEEDAVIAAHRAALRLSHRLLLIVIPSDPERAHDLAQKIETEEGWIVARRDLDQDPEPDVSVYIAETGDDQQAEFGLWYRLAPVAFMGGSLLGTGCARAPMQAAALGSAIIHGRRAGAYGADLGRLGAALGAAAVSTPAELSEVLAELLAPDRAARQAHAAWSVASEGAEVTDRVIATILELIGETR